MIDKLFPLLEKNDIDESNAVIDEALLTDSSTELSQSKELKWLKHFKTLIPN